MVEDCAQIPIYGFTIGYSQVAPALGLPCLRRLFGSTWKGGKVSPGDLVREA